MFDLKRLSTTVLGSAALILCAGIAPVTATPQPQLVITSATFDESNNRLVINGQNFSWPANGNGHAAPPAVTLDLMPLTVLSATPTQIVASLSGTFPDGTYLITVSRGQGAVESGAFAVAIYHEESVQGVVGPTGPAGPAGPQGPAGPMGPAGSVGSAGPAGAAGAVGPQGPVGQTGAVGPEGPAGPAGALGPIGPQGPVGPAGAMGPVGPVGPVGPAGPQGVIGATGPAGPQGVVGPQGPIGFQGPAGPQGVPGVSSYQIVSASNSSSLASGKEVSAKAVCPAGTRVISGGAVHTPPSATPVTTLMASYPDTNQSWSVVVRNGNSFAISAVSVTAYAICAIVN